MEYQHLYLCCEQTERTNTGQTTVSPFRSKPQKEVSWYGVSCISHLGTLVYKDSQALLLCFLCCRGDKRVPFEPCAQVRLFRLSHYHGSFVTLEEYPAWTVGISFPRAGLCCETSYIPDPQEIHETRRHREPKEKSPGLESNSKPAV